MKESLREISEIQKIFLHKSIHGDQFAKSKLMAKDTYEWFRL